jgi:hypothetical protein
MPGLLPEVAGHGIGLAARIVQPDGRLQVLERRLGFSQRRFQPCQVKKWFGRSWRQPDESFQGRFAA